MLRAKQRLSGTLRVPGDKSISHRALIFASFSKGKSAISGLSPAYDCLSTIDCLKALGLSITKLENGQNNTFEVISPGNDKLTVPKGSLLAGNSGTTIRLLSGLVAGQSFSSSFEGDASLQARPMSRVLEPLLQMGTLVSHSQRKGYAPYTISGGQLHGIDYAIPQASAQVQAALLLAGLQAEGETVISMPGSARDHTERLFQYLKIPHQLLSNGQIKVSRLLSPIDSYKLDIPADISSAAFFIVGATLLPGSKIQLKEVGINPGRRLIIDVLKQMNADIQIENERISSGEPICDLIVQYAGRLKGTLVDSSVIASGIDEIPILALAGAFCDGKLSVRGAQELRVKESDRLQAIITNLRNAGACITEFADGFDIEGQSSLLGNSSWLTFSDHRLAMTGMIASLTCNEPVLVDNQECIGISYPNFNRDLVNLSMD